MISAQVVRSKLEPGIRFAEAVDAFSFNAENHRRPRRVRAPSPYGRLCRSISSTSSATSATLLSTAAKRARISSSFRNTVSAMALIARPPASVLRGLLGSIVRSRASTIRGGERGQRKTDCVRGSSPTPRIQRLGTAVTFTLWYRFLVVHLSSPLRCAMAASVPALAVRVSTRLTVQSAAPGPPSEPRSAALLRAGRQEGAPESRDHAVTCTAARTPSMRPAASSAAKAETIAFPYS